VNGVRAGPARRAILAALACSLVARLPAQAPAAPPAAPPAAAGAPFETGVASWYGDPFHGRLTASGETFDKTALTAAHRSLPFGTLILVRNLDNGLEVTVRVTDRGPFVAGRILDLSEAAGRILGMAATGTARVALYLVAPAPVPLKRLQLGAYSVQANALAAGARAEAAGYPPGYERAGAVTRVLVIVPASGLEAALAALARVGFTRIQVSDQE